MNTITPSRPRLPLWLKLTYTAFLAVLIPVYWVNYGPTNFLYFCDVALFLTLAGVWLEKPLLISLPAVGILIPQALWFAGVRRNAYALFVLSLVINLGMWLERFVIVVVSLHRDYLPSSWGMYTPTFWYWSTFMGTIGLFTALMFLFIRLLPMISIFEMRELVEESEGHEP